MISCEWFYQKLINNQIDFFTGVPDSLLKDFNAYLLDHVKENSHIIASNEGGAVALAMGHHLASGKIPLVYMQNSGEGNAVNPLTSLVDPEVYSIPLLLLIGWRGEPGVHDEPQHKKQGKITVDLLNTLNIAHEILPNTSEAVEVSLHKAFSYMKSKNAPYALVVKKDTFSNYALKNKVKTDLSLTREQVVKEIVNHVAEKDVIVSTTGKTSRELFEIRESNGEGHEKDFLTVGGMGHASQIALGIALAKPTRAVYCVDGDGAVIMHMGSLAIIGSKQVTNFKHIVINNGAHESVGAQPTVGFSIDIPKIAMASGYKHAWSVSTLEEVKKKLALLKESAGPALLEVRVNTQARSDLGRPTKTPIENKKDLMDFLAK